MNVKHHEKIAERCRENGALYVDEFDYPRAGSRATLAATTNPPSYPVFTKAQIEAIHRLNDEAQRQARERLGSERIAVIKLDEQRRPDINEDWYLPTLSQAVERWNFRDWELLKMDEIFGGILVRDSYLLISKVHLKRIGISGVTLQ